MSGLGTCRTCKGVVAYGAKACPHCGQNSPAPMPLSRRPFALIVASLFGFVVLMIVLGGVGGTGREVVSSTQTPAPNPAQTEQAKKEALREAIGIDATAGCEVQVAKMTKDPKSLDVDGNQTRMKLEGDKGAVTIFYRAKNSFGAVVPGSSKCDFVVNSGSDTRITKVVASK